MTVEAELIYAEDIVTEGRLFELRSDGVLAARRLTVPGLELQVLEDFYWIEDDNVPGVMLNYRLRIHGICFAMVQLYTADLTYYMPVKIVGSTREFRVQILHGWSRDEWSMRDIIKDNPDYKRTYLRRKPRWPEGVKFPFATHVPEFNVDFIALDYDIFVLVKDERIIVRSYVMHYMSHYVEKVQSAALEKYKQQKLQPLNYTRWDAVTVPTIDGEYEVHYIYFRKRSDGIVVAPAPDGRWHVAEYDFFSSAEHLEDLLDEMRFAADLYVSSLYTFELEA